MNSARVAVALLVTGIAVGSAACGSASEDPPVLEGSGNQSDVVLADALVITDDGFARDARVSADRVVIVTAGHEDMIAKLHAGSIVVGRRSQAHPDLNAMGFLRNVQSVAAAGADTVIMTTNATLSDALVSGSFDVHGLLAAPGELTTRTFGKDDKDELNGNAKGALDLTLPDITILDLEAHSDIATKHVRVTPSVTGSVRLVDNALRLRATPHFSGKYSFPTTVKALHADFALDYDATSTLVVEAGGELAATIPKLSKEVTIGTFPIVSGWFAIGALPVEISVNVVASAKCELYAGGKADIRVAMHASGTPTAGVDYANGSWASAGNSAASTLDTKTSVQAETTFGVRCSASFALETLVYDAAGPFVSMANVIDIGKQTVGCSPPKQGVAVDTYRELELGAHARIWGYTLGEWGWTTDANKIRWYPQGVSPDLKCTEAQQCLTDTECGSGKACAWNGKDRCCRTPVPTAGAKKCLSDAECPGEVCAWNLDALVCQVAACN